MFAVCVDVWVEPGSMEVFLPLMQANAAASLTEEGCVQFDVVTPTSDPDLVVLYELYTDEAAFQAHLQTSHFKEFDAASAAIISAKSVLTGPRLDPR